MTIVCLDVSTWWFCLNIWMTKWMGLFHENFQRLELLLPSTFTTWSSVTSTVRKWKSCGLIANQCRLPCAFVAQHLVLVKTTILAISGDLQLLWVIKLSCSFSCCLQRPLQGKTHPEVILCVRTMTVHEEEWLHLLCSLLIKFLLALTKTLQNDALS